MDSHSIIAILAALLGSGGILGGIYALLKLRPEAGQITVSTAQGVLIMQTTVIDQLAKDNKDVRERVDVLVERAGVLDGRFAKALDDLADCLDARKVVHERLTALERKYGIES